MKVVLHLCADIGSDSFSYQQDKEYKVIRIGVGIGVENVRSTSSIINIPEHGSFLKSDIVGIIANPVCTEFSTARGFHKANDSADTSVLDHCMRIIDECDPQWWVIENPFNGTMKKILGKPDFVYQPWEFGSPWTKKTALWGKFNHPKKLYSDWQDVPKNDDLYIRPGRKKPSLAFLHKSAIQFIDEFKPFVNRIHCDNAFRSLCSQGFASEFKKINP